MLKRLHDVAKKPKKLTDWMKKQKKDAKRYNGES
jgi:hypothetical protein